MLELVPDYYKNQQMSSKAVDRYHHVLKFVPDCYITQNMSDKAVNTHPSTVQCYKTQEICDKVVNRCFLYLILLLIGIKLKKYMTKLILLIYF